MRRISPWVTISLALSSALTAAAPADSLIAIRPGVVCASSDALAILTLPNGDSRPHQVPSTAKDQAVAASGGCINIPPGATVQVLQSFHNTSRVTYAEPGAPANSVMTVPNIDFRSGDGVAAAGPALQTGYAPAQRVAAGAGMMLLLLQDERITPAIREAMEPSGSDPDQAFVDNS